MAQTNAEYAKTNRLFKYACQAAGIAATSRQASKFRRKRGLAYQHKLEGKMDMEMARRAGLA